MNSQVMQEEIDRLNEQVSLLEEERQELIYKASPIKIGCKVKSPIDGESWTVIDVEYEFGTFRYLLEDAEGKNLQMLSEKNLRQDPLEGKVLKMSVNDGLVSVKIKE